MNSGWTIFPSAIGDLGLSWRDGEILRVVLPDERAVMTRRLNEHGVRQTPPAWVQAIVDALARHVAGEPQDFSAVPLAFAEQPPFRQAIYAITRGIPVGRTLSYGELATRAGSPGGARAVGQAMAHNPCPILMPCHRVVAANGRPGGFTAAGGLTIKARLLLAEGARLPGVELPPTLF